MGLYERLLEERAEEEQRLGGPLPRMRSLDSKVLVRRLEDPSRRRPGYTADLSIMHRLKTRALATLGRACGSGA
jgi:hypothetical protein